MKVGEYLRETCRESRIHGTAYLIRDDLHWFEKVFWSAAILAATYFSISICWNQWQRFRDNPITYGYIDSWEKMHFPVAGSTICIDYYDDDELRPVVKKIFNVTKSKNPEAFDYYMQFLRVVNVLRFDRLETLEPYANDTTLKNIDFLEMLLAIHKDILGTPVFETDEQKPLVTSEYNWNDRFDNHLPASINEVGLCRSTSHVTQYTNPYNFSKRLTLSTIDMCNIIAPCTTKIFPNIQNHQKFSLFLHDIHDVVSPDMRLHSPEQVSHGSGIETDIEINWTGAQSIVRSLPVNFRKCRYPDENFLQYYNDYRPGLCRMECRLRAALDNCQCKPFFYAAAPDAPKCNIDGLLCLANSNWTQTKCPNCLPLCEEIRYVVQANEKQSTNNQGFSVVILLRYTIPRFSILRRVIFSTDQLIVAFGGAVGLFLGASFVGVAGIIYAFSLFVCRNSRVAVIRCRKGYDRYRQAMKEQTTQMELSENNKEDNTNKINTDQVNSTTM